MLDVEALATAVAAACPVHLLPTGDLTWQLSSVLPEKLQVYGGATRIWWPGLRLDDDPAEHPLLFVHSEREGAAAIERVVRELRKRGFTAADTPTAVSPPQDRSRRDLVGVVEAIVYHGADLTLADGTPGYAPADKLVRRRPSHPRPHFWPGPRSGSPPTASATSTAAERYQRILTEELLYAREFTCEHDRAAAIGLWNIHCNYHRPHSAAGGQPPASRLKTGVTNVRPSYS